MLAIHIADFAKTCCIYIGDLFRAGIGQCLSKHSLLSVVDEYCSWKSVGSLGWKARVQMTKTHLPALVVAISCREESVVCISNRSEMSQLDDSTYLFLAPEWDFNLLAMPLEDWPKGAKGFMNNEDVELTIEADVLVEYTMVSVLSCEYIPKARNMMWAEEMFLDEKSVKTRREKKPRRGTPHKQYKSPRIGPSDWL